MKYRVFESFENSNGVTETYLSLETDDAEEAKEYGRANMDPFTNIEIRYNETESGYEVLDYNDEEKLYIIFDDCGTEFFTEEFSNEIRAVMTANRAWMHMSEHDQKRRKAYYVGYGTVDNHDIIKRYK